MEDFAREDDQGRPYEVYEIILRGGLTTAASSDLGHFVPAAAKQLKRLGGRIARPHKPLSGAAFRDATPLGEGLVGYTALTIASFADDRFFESGGLVDLGQQLRAAIELPSWQAFAGARNPEIPRAYQLTVELSEIEEGSLKWLKRFVLIAQGGAAVVGIMAKGPEAYENWDKIYHPFLVEALEASQDYVDLYLDGLREIADITINPVNPRLPDPTPVKRQQHELPVRRKPPQQKLGNGQT